MLGRVAGLPVTNGFQSTCFALKKIRPALKKIRSTIALCFTKASAFRYFAKNDSQ
ncbi:gsl0334 [Gloeobacter violaceus PCC 7421]|uniref:Gsl0334 protein n=1 Tax=Gloeobacter violaceus (strain ATCC 29082 / PCC 7421) TaxID=251221 RepID=Q7NNS6_GLOVI|nr:gsl0334 [Gloeobacter violaceus PCC 7421]